MTVDIINALKSKRNLMREEIHCFLYNLGYPSKTTRYETKIENRSGIDTTLEALVILECIVRFSRSVISDARLRVCLNQKGIIATVTTLLIVLSCKFFTEQRMGKTSFKRVLQPGSQTSGTLKSDLQSSIKLQHKKDGTLLDRIRSTLTARAEKTYFKTFSNTTATKNLIVKNKQKKLLTRRSLEEEKLIYLFVNEHNTTIAVETKYLKICTGKKFFAEFTR